MDEPEQYVDFMVKYKDWISIRRQSFDRGTKPEEIAYVLSTIRSSIEKRYYSILGIDTGKLDQYVAKIAQGKGYSGLAKIAGALDSKDTKEAASDACADKNLKKVAESYIVAKAIETAGIKAYVDPEELMRIYPELKIYKPKKPRGSKKGGADDAE
jgi:Glu-tRNA(Gln) amidotransferase subunit E-like FAD-binding protein